MIEGGRSRAWIALLVVALGFGVACNRGGGGWRQQELAAQTIDWRGVKGQRLLDLYATPSIAPRRVDLLLCRWDITKGPIRISWPETASEIERAAFETAQRAWSEVVPGLVLEASAREDAQITFDFVTDDDPRVPEGTADAVADCRIDAGSEALAPLDERGHIVQASIVMRRDHVDWSGKRTPMKDDEIVGAVIHELGHALGIAGHITGGWSGFSGRGSIMTADRDRVKRIGRRVAKGEPLNEPTLEALYLVPVGANVGVVGFDRALRDALAGLAMLARREGWAGPFGRAGGGTAEVFWRTEEGRELSIYTHEWADGIRGKRALDWRLSLSARQVLEALE